MKNLLLTSMFGLRYFLTFGQTLTKNINNRLLQKTDLTRKVLLNEIGQVAYNEWLKTPEIRPNVSLDVFEIMPNHMHGIILINESGGRGELHSPGDNGRGESHAPNNESHSPNNKPHSSDDDNNRGECNSPLRVPFRSPSNNVGAIVRGYKGAVTKQINLLNTGVTVWQGNYHEHIIRNEKSYQRISDYIINNEANWNEDKFQVK